MGQVLHGSATAAEAVRRAIQRSQASLTALAKRYGINQKTVAKWKGRTSVADLEPKPRSRKRNDNFPRVWADPAPARQAEIIRAFEHNSASGE
jgi:transposase-like protein